MFGDANVGWRPPKLWKDLGPIGRKGLRWPLLLSSARRTSCYINQNDGQPISSERVREPARVMDNRLDRLGSGHCDNALLEIDDDESSSRIERGDRHGFSAFYRCRGPEITR